MQLQLGHVLAGLAPRSGKPQRQRLVDHLSALRIAHARKRSLARLGNFPGERLQRIAGARAGEAHHGDRRRRAAGGEGEDGIASLGHLGPI
jgi:hypothetical protein